MVNKPQRPESPGGYFTLSDSDHGGTESSLEQDEQDIPNRVRMYKMYKRSRSEPPQDEKLPPRPPPPLSYTSTLPPPVPKKGNTLNKNNKKANYRTPPPPLSNTPGPKTKPLQRVQPLQIQSPSMIQILQHNKNCSSTSSDENNSLEQVTTFVSSFQKATKNMELGNVGKPRPPLRCEQKQSGKQHGDIHVAGYMRPTKTAVLKQQQMNKNEPKKVRKSSISSGSEEHLSSGSEANVNKKKTTRNKSSDNNNNSTQQKLKKLKNSVFELKKAKSESHVNKNPIHSLIKFYEASQENKKQQDDRFSQLSQMSAEKIQSWLSNPLNQDLNVTEVSVLDKYVTDMISLADVSKMESLSDDCSCSSSSDEDKYPRVIMKSPKVIMKMNETKNLLMKKVKSEKAQKMIQTDKKKDIIKKTSESLSKLKKDLKKSESPKSTKKIAKESEMSKLKVDSPKITRKSTEISQRGAKSIESSPQLNQKVVQKPKDSPKVKRKVVQNTQESPKLSVKSAKNDSPKLSQKVKNDSSKSVISSPKIMKNIHFEHVVSQTKALKIIPDDEDETTKVWTKPQATVIEDKIPSEEEIQRGVFTQVSYAGNVKKFQPIPSPRVKKKARKEHLLLEHKEKGHQALSMVMKQLKQVDSKEESKASNEEEEGMKCLDELCSQSQIIQQDINKHLQNEKKDDKVRTCKMPTKLNSCLNHHTLGFLNLFCFISYLKKSQ